MPLPEEYRKELVARREQEHREAERDRRRDMALTILEVFAWTVLGLFVMGLSWWVESEEIGEPLWVGGRFIGVAGIFWTLLRAHRRRHQRGDA